jgi:hypothetical protein
MDFPANAFDSVTHGNFLGAFAGCPLTPQSLENILTSLVSSTVEGGFINFEETIELTVDAEAALVILEGRNWSINPPLVEDASGYYYYGYYAYDGIGAELL